MKKHKKQLETISLGYSQGIVSIDVLMKACSTYKQINNIFDDEEYDLKVSKSVFDYINNIKSNKEILKAIVPGQTKYVNGVLYVYSATKVGSKTEYGWHVARKSNVGRSSKIDDVQVKSLQKQVNEMFPADINSVSVVKRLGGSTGAQLVKDVHGNEYVMKKGTNTNAGHVRSEYMTNMIYNILGQKTPNYELYDANDDNKVTLLSQFIPGTRVPNSGDFSAMAEGFIADVLVANWDVYQNDNCLINAGGQVIRVDNGGSLYYRAQGALKNPPFDGNVLVTYENMLKHNSLLAKSLTDDGLIKQIDEALSKKNDIVNFLNESGDDKLANIFDKRIEGLKKIKDKIIKDKQRKANLAAVKAGKVPPRQLLPEDEMYRVLDEEEINDIFEEVNNLCGGNKQHALNYKGSAGWDILSKLCVSRGFDARPEVVSEDEFWKVAKDADLPIMFRGLKGDGKVTGSGYCDAFRYDDQCYYGTEGIWGQGIYAHTDDINGDSSSNYASKNQHSNKSNYKKSASYKHAQNYAWTTDGAILKMAWAKDANVIDHRELLKEIQSNPPQTITDPKIKKKLDTLKNEVKELKDDWMKLEIKLQNVYEEIEENVKKKNSYNEDAITDMYDTIANTDWGNRTSSGKLSYPNYEDFVCKNMKSWIEKNGGSVEINDEYGYTEFEIQGEKMSISKSSWDLNNIKVKNSITPPYAYQAELFKTFFETNYLGVIQKKIEREKRQSKKIEQKLKVEIQKKKDTYENKKKEYTNELNKNLTGDLYNEVYKSLRGVNERSSCSLGALGIYAAMKGYDGYYVHNGNGDAHGFNVILNRSKIIVSNQNN